jgi:hypothetical protein
MGANYIVLAEAKANLSSDNRRTEFLFETKEVLKGDAPESFKLEGFSRRDHVDILEDFDGHTDPQFWAYPYGNSIMTTFCSVMGVFEVGRTYLVIDTDMGHFKGYENIRSEDDLWLKVIRLLVRELSDVN